MSQATLAVQLTQELNRPFDRSAINKMTLGKRKVSAEEMMAIEKITGLTAQTEPDVPQEQNLYGQISALISYRHDDKELELKISLSLEHSEQLETSIRSFLQQVKMLKQK